MEGHILGARMRIPGIKVLRLIGEGGMSRVYLASRDKDDEPLVVKILRSEVTQDKRSLARFIEEYNLVERIRSRHVARIHGHGVSEDNAYLVMEFFDGGDLNKRLDNKALPPEEALRLFRELMFALGDIHERGILHRDLKPQNLMFRSDGSLAIVDFGIAKHIDSIDRTNKGEILGTPRYMSPEQVQGRALDLRTDIYSAGVLLYQMMLGEHLFSGETAVEVALHHLNTPPPRRALPQRRRGDRLPVAQVLPGKLGRALGVGPRWHEKEDPGRRPEVRHVRLGTGSPLDGNALCIPGVRGGDAPAARGTEEVLRARLHRY
jgi:serine/threonine protein kinase